MIPPRRYGWPDGVLGRLGAVRFRVGRAFLQLRISAGVSAGGAPVGMKQFHPRCLQSGAAAPAAGADEIIEAGNLAPATGGMERFGESAADKAADTGNQDAHVGQEKQSGPGR